MNEQFWLMISPVILGGILATIVGYWFVRRERKEADREREHQARRP